jgi:hypothetical protein
MNDSDVNRRIIEIAAGDATAENTEDLHKWLEILPKAQGK